MLTPMKPPLPSPVSGRPPGFSLVEFLVVAFILAVGLLGLGRMQLATVRAEARAEARQTALQLAEAVLETIQAEARGAGDGPEPGRWLGRFDRDGLPAAGRPAFFVVTVTGSAPGGCAPARLVRASVAWAEDAARPGRLTLFRLIAR
jgi:prepilin-type N-terminal cleavage/methylation domain-containing protein